MNSLMKFLTGGLLAAFAAQAAAADTIRIGYQNEPDPSHVAIVDGLYEKATGDKIEVAEVRLGRQRHRRAGLECNRHSLRRLESARRRSDARRAD